MKSLKVKIKLDYLQSVKLETLSNEHRLLYNHLLGKIKDDKPSDFKTINENYKNFRKENNLTINSNSSQLTSRNLINSILSFYQLKKKDKDAKFPYKFKSWKFFQSFTFNWNNSGGGFKIINNEIIINLLSCAKKEPNLIIKLPEYCKIINEYNIKTLSFKKENDDYYIVFVYSEKDSNKNIEDNNNFISIDLGISNIITSFSNKRSNFSVRNLKQKKLQKRIEEVQSKKDKKTKNSKKHKKLNKTYKRLKRKQSNIQKDFQHKLSRIIVNECIENNISKLIIGDLKVKSILKSDNHKINGLSKSTSSLGRFKTFLEYKSKNEDISFYKISEYNTSKMNCITKEISLNSDLKNREFELIKDVFIDRDLNSAINIANKVMGECLTQFSKEDFLLNKMYFDLHQCKLRYDKKS